MCTKLPDSFLKSKSMKKLYTNSSFYLIRYFRKKTNKVCNSEFNDLYKVALGMIRLSEV